MKQFIDKLIGRLEEEKKYCSYHPHTRDEAINKAIQIVNELAEEYKGKANDAWKIIYDNVCNLEKEYATKGNMESVNDCIRLENLLQYFKEELRSTEKYNGGWIPCEVRLPDNADLEYFLVWCKGYFTAGTHIGEECQWYGIGLLYNKNKWEVYQCKDIKDIEVIAWLPLPAPYKKGE